MSRSYNTYTAEEELRMAQLVAEGKTIKEVAAAMNVRHQVIEYRMQKLRVQERCLSTPHLITKLILGGRISPNL